MKVFSVHPYSSQLNGSMCVNTQNKKNFKGVPSRLVNEVLNANSSQLKRLGEMFHKEFPSDALYETSGAYHGGGRLYDKAFKILEHAREQVNRHRKIIADSVVSLSQKSNLDAENLVKAKNTITNNFIDLIKIETDRGTATQGIIPNGILIYGNSTRVNSQLLEHAQKANVNFREVNFDLHRPFESIRDLFDVANSSKNIFDATNRRTLIHFKNFDELLAAPKTRQNKDAINVFKQFMEIASDQHKTTVAITTTKNIDNLDIPAIGDHRFELEVRCNSSLSDLEISKLNADKAEISRLDKMAEEGRKINQEEKSDYDDSLSLHFASERGWG
ncbi:hypothetical protein J6Q66_02650 [bacterium]|nr:hypothetical protein [bacterium]